ncbi:hypothetical protein [uncultured Algibacter sp.]|uniref:hypothetical protein n=1 Tax=uncultured Algibacter sp. TaxID=298659 RepID=UPI002616D188|nr:hypothetical protein [uncultured Algibacter sp.]
MTEKQEKFLHKEKFTNSNKGLVLGSLIATLIAITPYLFSLYESVPATKSWDTFLFTYTSDTWEDANYAMWTLTGKAVPLMLLFLWFFTCRHWWYHALLVPIVMYFFQIGVILFGDVAIDEFQLIYLIPVMAIVIPTIYLIRARIFNKMNEASKSMQQLEDELKMSPKGLWGKISQYF